MNLDFDQIKTQMADLHQREREAVQQLEGTVERLQRSGLCLPREADLRPAFPLPSPSHPSLTSPPSREMPRPKVRAKAAKVAKAAKAEPNEHKANNRSQLCSDVRAWIATRAGAFSVQDLPASLRTDLVRVRKVLGNLCTQKKLKRAGNARGVWLGGGGGSAPPQQAKRQLRPTAKPRGSLDIHQKRRPALTKGAMAFSALPRRASKHQEAIAEIAMKLGPAAQWGAKEMEQWLENNFPALMITDSQRSDYRVRLVDMANNGYLVREGMPPFSTYRLGPKLAQRDVPCGNEEKKLNVSVPRDADAGEEG